MGAHLPWYVFMKFYPRLFIISFLLGFFLPYACTRSNADEPKGEVYSTVAVGVFNSGLHSLSEEKFLNVGYRSALGPLVQQVEVGGFTDRAGNGRSGSAYGAYQVGFEVHGPILGRICTGPALISSPDSYLGGVFQFTEDFYAGEEDTHGHSIGFLYKHISSAGLEQPNIGRDQMGFQIGLRF
jgi:hypothetical protein